METSFNDFVKRADTDQAALGSVYYVCLWKYGISGPTLVHLTSKFFVLCINMKFYQYIYSYWVEPNMNIHEGNV